MLQEPVERVAVITLRPTRKEQRKKVVWAEDTVDNEHMNKKKSKCCCIYEKPHKFGESDSESSDDECEHCYGHVEVRKENKTQRQGGAATAATTVTVTEQTPEPEATACIALQPSEPTAPPDKPEVEN